VNRWLACGLLLAASSQLLGGCASIDYYAQAVSGHLDVMSRAQPIDDVLANSDTSDALRKRLLEVAEIRAFASTNLGLPNNDSYTHYADLERAFAVWNVVATPGLSLAPRKWCFPVVGCVSYRGYYAKADAQALADSLKAAGDDVLVAGARAYSTLGWFDDPVLNTMFVNSPTYLPQVIFHELAHQRLYIEDDSAFNEALASAVARAGVRRWLDRRGSYAEQQQYAREQLRQVEFLEVVSTLRSELTSLYATDLLPAQKQMKKTQALNQAKARYQHVSASWPEPRAYQYFFDAHLNNARIAAVATYQAWVPAFELLMREANGDVQVFLARMDELAKLAPPARHQVLQAALDKTSAGQ
jgi:predicted aminopeptidase